MKDEVNKRNSWCHIVKSTSNPVYKNILYTMVFHRYLHLLCVEMLNIVLVLESILTGRLQSVKLLEIFFIRIWISRGWTQNGSKCYWMKKQIEAFLHSPLDLCFWTVYFTYFVFCNLYQCLPFTVFYAPLRRREGILLCTCRSVGLSVTFMFPINNSRTPWPSFLKLSQHIHPGQQRNQDFGVTRSKVKVTRVKSANTE